MGSTLSFIESLPVNWHHCFSNQPTATVWRDSADSDPGLKKDKYPLSCDSYRHLSLLKVLAKILELRLEGVLQQVISEDQNGFIKGWQLCSSLCMLLDISYSKPFISWICLLYTSPLASFYTNEVQSVFFPYKSRDTSGLSTFTYCHCYWATVSNIVCFLVIFFWDHI